MDDDEISLSLEFDLENYKPLGEELASCELNSEILREEDVLLLSVPELESTDGKIVSHEDPAIEYLPCKKNDSVKKDVLISGLGTHCLDHPDNLNFMFETSKEIPTPDPCVEESEPLLSEVATMVTALVPPQGPETKSLRSARKSVHIARQEEPVLFPEQDSAITPNDGKRKIAAKKEPIAKKPKMHELDPVQNPRAKGAITQRARRERMKQEAKINDEKRIQLEKDLAASIENKRSMEQTINFLRMEKMTFVENYQILVSNQQNQIQQLQGEITRLQTRNLQLEKENMFCICSGSGEQNGKTH